MLTGFMDPVCHAKLQQELTRNPAFSVVMDVVREAEESYAIDPLAGGLEFAPADTPSFVSGQTRCRMKLFRPREEKERLCAFFFKKSNIQGSRDRFSYGAVEFLPEKLTPEEVRLWLRWLTSGLDPELRPTNLKRAFLYTIPE
jgi:hypothetical protein